MLANVTLYIQGQCSSFKINLRFYYTFQVRERLSMQSAKPYNNTF